MKKFVALILAVVMVFALAVSANAVGSTTLDGEGINGSKEVDVNIVVGGSLVSPTIYYVTLAWGSMEFHYDLDESTRQWNPETHADVVNYGTPGWTPGQGQSLVDGNIQSSVTITNHSNAAVNYTATLSAGVELAGVSVALSGNNVENNRGTGTLESGVDKTFATADNEIYTVIVSGAPTNKVAGTTTVKTLTIALSAG